MVEIERQAGNWLLDGGYVGQNVTEQRVAFTFAPDRSLAKSILGRAFYSADPRRTFLIEAAVQQNGDGYYGKAEFSEGMGQHWRLTMAAVGLGGEAQNFLGSVSPQLPWHGDPAVQLLNAPRPAVPSRQLESFTSAIAPHTLVALSSNFSRDRHPFPRVVPAISPVPSSTYVR